ARDGSVKREPRRRPPRWQSAGRFALCSVKRAVARAGRRAAPQASLVRGLGPMALAVFHVARPGVRIPIDADAHVAVGIDLADLALQPLAAHVFGLAQKHLGAVARGPDDAGIANLQFRLAKSQG